jgi:SAM-dependent methyltransferase
MDWRREHERAEASNRELWNEMARVHFSAYKELDLLRRGEEILDPVELHEVGDVRGKTLLHLQCHIGTDTLAWARHGAAVTGVDFSPAAIGFAERLRDELEVPARFILSNVYDLPSVLGETFDVVYTSRGILCWLRDLEEWARIVARFLKPGGIFYLLDGHPFVNALEEKRPGEVVVAHRYFHEPKPIVYEAGGPDYAAPHHALQHPSHEWVWSLSEIVNAALAAGLRLELLSEHERTFHPQFPSMTTDDGRVFRMPSHEGMLPLFFSLRARKA